MTGNQINYWNLQENKRHNVVTEEETGRHNRATESIDLGNLNETRRHNLATERLEGGKLSETTRHNLAYENELSRHNKVGEEQNAVNLGISRDTLNEAIRHNFGSESLTARDLNIRADSLAETGRHNVATESISKYQAVSQAQLNDAHKALTELQTTWEGIKQSQNIKLTDANRRYYDQQIQNLQKQLEILDTDQSLKEEQYYLNVYDRFLDTINAASRAVDSFIPG